MVTSVLRRAGSRPALVAIGVLAVGLTACAPGSNSAGGSSTAPSGGGSAGAAASPTSLPTDPAAMGNLTLVVWDQEVRGGQDAQIKQLNSEFHAKYPNITIKRVSRSFTDLKTTLKLALSGSEPPDVVEANNGRSDLGAFVQAGLVRPLDSYAAAYGWDTRYPASVRALSSYTADGKTFGSGNLYGLPQSGEVVGVFYNKSKLTKLGIPVPTTWQEFTADLAKAKAAGEVPVAFGNLDKWPGIHEFGTIQGRHVAPDTIRTLAFGAKGASWTTPENTAAAQEMVDWVTKGYFTPGFNGVGYDPVWQDFGKGKGVFLIAGTWLLADLAKAMGGNVGFMLPPSPQGQGPVAMGGTSLPFAITAKSAHPDAAAAYINFLTSEHAMQVLTQTGNLPVVDASKQQLPDGVQKDVFTAWDTVTSKDGLTPYLDYATPTMYDTITADVQDLLAKKKSPQQFLQTLQDDYGKFVSGNG